MKFKYLLCSLFLFGIMGCESDNSSGSSEGTTANAEKVPEAPSEPTFSLKWNVPSDHSFVQKGKEAEKVTLYPGTDQEQTSKLSVTASRKFNISGIDKEGAFTVKMNYIGVMGEFKSPQDKWIYDSNSAKPGDKGGGLENLAGASITFRIDPNTGQVLEVFDSEDLSKVLAGDGQKIDGADKMMRESLQPEWYVYPDGPVKMGEEWTREIKLKHRYQSLLKLTFKLASRENGQAKIAFNGSVAPLAEADRVMGKTNLGEPFYHELSGTTSGEIVIDEASGDFFSQTSTTILEGHQVIEDDKGMEMKRIPLKIEMEGFSEYGQK